MAEKRIVDLAEVTEFSNEDYLVVDSRINGTRKIKESLITNAIGAPFVASTVAAMTDENRVYVYTGSETGYVSGNWYYYNGSAWVSGGVYNSTAFETDTTLTEPGEAADARATGDAIREAVALIGATSGAVQTLTDSTPYLFRQTPKAGHNEYDEIVGGTVAWNQLVSQATFPTTHEEGGITVAWQNDGGVKFSGTISDGNPHWEYIACVGYIPADNHKYLVTTTQAPTNTGGRFGILRGNGTFDYSGDNKSYYMFINDSRFNAINYRLTNGTYDFTAYFNLFDLTQLFGSTIADAIYAMEQATAGSGVAYFKSLFPNSYYAYNAGELLSVSGVSSHQMVGFNQWDEVWEAGSYDGNGAKITSSAQRIRSKGYIRVLPSTTYYTLNMWHVWECDANKAFVKENVFADGEATSASGSFTTTTRTRYVTFASPKNYGTTYKNDICINISDTAKNGTYEPYELHSYPLDSDLTLRGIPKWNNGLYYDGDTYEADGTVTRKYGIVDLGSLNWTFISATNAFYADIQGGPTAVATGNEGVCAKYPIFIGQYSAMTAMDKIATIANASFSSAQGRIVIIDTSYSSASAFKTAMDGVYLVYELATPTTESADPYTNPQICDPSGTEEYVSTSIVPVGHNTEYPMTLSDIKPTSNGTYVLKCTVTNGVPTYEWVSA